MSRVFLDSNVLVYSVELGDLRQARAARLLDSGTVISVQCLNEFVSVAHRKLNLPWSAIAEARDTIVGLCDRVVPLTLELHQLGLDMAQRHQFAIYDAMIVAAALSAGCETLYSEDMHDGLVIDGRLTIRNPFA